MRYVLFHRGDQPGAADLDMISGASGVQVIDRELGRAMLVEAEQSAVDALRRRLSSKWMISPESFLPGPDLP
ncbi:MAG TPA: hypothetical protein VGD36_15630 [Xanthobacteraceae bacterium]|jgi:hypothetical protein